MARIDDKIEEIRNYLDELSDIMPSSFDLYSSSLEKRLACERSFEKIVEAMVSLALLVITTKRMPKPSEDNKAFDILSQEKIISPKLAIKLKEAKGMRNILAHEYGQIDDELVFEAVTEEITADAEELISSILKTTETFKY
ncbi:MAG: DUF86 domain-containing protein [Nanoarchaeota archaeon]|nr:DUF86 domain-containing protein [Nanoarchaeota archaeon]MBU1704170.1 DUF86 domain-containing protein [Nanoarchaeota archaeon]